MRSNKSHKVTAEISPECIKELKIYAIRKDMTMQETIREILERILNKKSKGNDIITQN